MALPTVPLEVYEQACKDSKGFCITCHALVEKPAPDKDATYQCPVCHQPTVLHPEMAHEQCEFSLPGENEKDDEDDDDGEDNQFFDEEDTGDDDNDGEDTDGEAV
jgi:hypothetical protein